MKKSVKRFLIMIVVIVTIISFSTTGFAYSRLGTGKISGGATSILYWRDSYIYEYRHSLGYGIKYWNGHTSKVSVSRTSTKSYSRCDCYWGQYLAPGYIAVTELYLNNVQITSYNVNWYWCKLKFDSDYYNYDDMTYFHRKGTACHEHGHFLGLGHSNSDPTSIMCQTKYGRTAGTPSTDDINGIKAIYRT